MHACVCIKTPLTNWQLKIPLLSPLYLFSIESIVRSYSLSYSSWIIWARRKSFSVSGLVPPVNQHTSHWTLKIWNTIMGRQCQILISKCSMKSCNMVVCSSLIMSKTKLLKTVDPETHTPNFRIPGHFIYMCRCAFKNEVYNNSCYSYSMRC